MSVMKPVAVVGLGAVLPDAFDAPTFWNNIKSSRYSISEVPAERWKAELYYDPDPLATDKTYSKIGGWVRDFKFDPFKLGIAIPPRVIQQMDVTQLWAISATHQALSDYGYPKRALDLKRMAVIFGNAMGGENHYVSTLRIRTPDFMEALRAVPQFQSLPRDLQHTLLEGMRANIQASIPDITEDTMPGELSNIIAGRVANVFNFQGPNFTTDAACASSLAAIQAAVEGLNSHKFDAVVSGGVDRMMGAEGFVKFSKIGALSPDGSRPYADGANGFVMGEGAGVVLLKRLEDAEKDGDRIYAVLRGIGSSSDGKGKGITAPNPSGQQQAIVRAWQNAGLDPATVGLIEGHGTSTRVGDVVEVNSLTAVFGPYGLPVGKIALGSVKSNIGHLKGAAGAAGLLKTVLALDEKVLPPSVNYARPNPAIDFEHIPFYVNTALRPWQVKPGEVRRAGLSAFGFGGTNFHVVVEEYLPGQTVPEKPLFAGVEVAKVQAAVPLEVAAPAVQPYRGLFFAGAGSAGELKEAVRAALEAVKGGARPPSGIPTPAQMTQPERIAIDYGEREEFLKRAERALKGFDAEGNPWAALIAHGVFRGSGAPGKVAFLFPGQGSQYVNMLKDLCTVEPIAAATFAEADRVMEPILGRPLTSFIYVDGGEAEMAAAEQALRNTEITQPAVLTANVALLRLMERFGFEPDLVIGHSLGEYAALVSAGVLTFSEALEVVSARGQEMKKVSWDDNGCMAAVSAPIAKVEGILREIDGYVVLANINSPLQSVIGGTTEAVEKALAAFAAAGYQGTKIPVSHAFHTKIVAPASEPLRRVIERMNVQTPRRPIVANVTGEVYPTTRDEILDILARQVASPVQFVKGMQTLYEQGARVFAEIGPKRVLNALATDNLKGKPDVMILATNHPREGAVISFNKALCGLYAAGIGPKEKAAEIQPVHELERGEIKQFVVQLVSEKTGYPVEMLDLELDLEADLGIDTVKQAELFAAVRTRYAIPRRDDLRLAEYNTLDKVVGFVTTALAENGSARPATIHTAVSAAPLQAVVSSAPAALPGLAREEVKQFVLGLVSEKTGYPAEMLELELDLEADLGVDTVKQAELFAAVRANYAIPRREDLRLSDYNTLEKVIGFVLDATPTQEEEPAAVNAAPLPMMRPDGAAEKSAPAAGAALNGRLPLTGSVVISGAGLGLPGKSGRVFDEGNIAAILNGELRIEQLSDEKRHAMLEKRVTRLVKHEAGAVMELIDQFDQTIKLGGQRGLFDLSEEFGVPGDRVAATDISTQLAIAAGIDALRDAGIPLVMNYKQTSKGTLLPDRWKLPEALADETGVIFGSAFPGLDEMALETSRYSEYTALLKQADELRGMLALVPAQQSDLRAAFDKRLAELDQALAELNYSFDRRFVFRVLPMGHSQFAEHIGARGPNTHVNAACATTTHALALAEDWIRGGRARRVVIIAGDDVTSQNLMPWVGTGLMASGAATVEGNPRLAILPFDKRRNGMIMGMGGAALVVEAEDALRERGMRGIAEVLATTIANSAYHGTRLEVNHVGEVMERTLRVAESRFGLRRAEMAARTVFVSHETYTPARGGSAAAEIRALRSTFGENAHQVVIANTKGFTGHTMGVGVEDVVALKALETGIVPPIAHIHDAFEPDPDLGDLNLSKGGQYDPRFSLRLGAGFGSQIAMSLLRKVAGSGERVRPAEYQKWLGEISGYAQADLEVERHTLRIRHAGPPKALPRKSVWEYGQGPTLWAGWEEESPADVEPAARLAAPQTGRSAGSLPPAGQSEQSAPLGSAPDEEAIKAFVLAQVSEKTGYPPEMLDLELDLEADLGIDTVKQAELFAAVRANYGIPRREDLRLSDYNTLMKVIGFVQEALRQGSKAAPEEVPAVEAALNPAGATDRAAVQTYVMGLISEKTGYPAEMLDPELDLEADLGIDTVKQAELFAAVRTNYAIPRREDLRLSDYNTLSKVVGFVLDALKGSSPAPVSETGGTATDAAQGQLAEPATAVEYPRRMPVMVLRPRLELCTATGIELGAGCRVVIVAGKARAGAVLVRGLRARKVEALLVDAQDLAAIAVKVGEFAAQGRVSGVYFLPGLDVEAPLEEMSAGIFQAELEKRTLALYAALKAIPGEPFVISATRLGGLHGYGAQGASAPLGGAVSGLTKAIGVERAGCLVKVVDFETNTKENEVVQRLIAETLHDPAAVEIGWEKGLRYAVGLMESAAGEENFPLAQGSVFVVSGGSGGITGPVLGDLARATKGTFFLLSRTQLPERQDPDLARLKNDRGGLKAELLRRLAQAGEKATPAMVEQRISALERGAQTLESMRGIEAAGGKAVYLVCDITSSEAVEQAAARIAAECKQVDVFIHAAGVERSRKIENKSEAEFRQTLQVKVLGFFNLYQSLSAKSIAPRCVVMFSSIAGRFGNSGQTDYSAANDALAKLAASLGQRKTLKALTIDWGAWAEVGMASRGFIPELMKRAGIEMMKPESAAPLVRREITCGANGGEVVLAGSLGALLQNGRGEGGLDLEKANQALTAGQPVHTMLSRAAGLNLYSGVALEAELDPSQEPFLRDHALNGIPLLPGVMGIEGLSVAAQHVASTLASGESGFRVSEIREIQFLAPLKFYRGENRTAIWRANVRRVEDGLVADVVLESRFKRFGREAETIVHFRGKVGLQPLDAPRPVKTDAAPYWNGAATLAASDIYRLYFHGPAFQVLESVQRIDGKVLGKFRAEQPQLTEVKHGLATAPVLVELCLQTAGVWEIGKTGTLALPSGIGRLTLYRSELPARPVYAEVTPHSSAQGLYFDARVLDDQGQVYLVLENYQTEALPYSMDQGLLAPVQAWMQEKD